jgi:hypothetical protein
MTHDALEDLGLDIRVLARNEVLSLLAKRAVRLGINHDLGVRDGVLQKPIQNAR